ncbi:hypothetical protein [Streptomyces sp. WAC06614]|uniref:hypothetical protein n=1 Tax=Streptomyces sp. WAC06614 TaxID=2487416 RepID=UPI000F78638F|nr:hypothetical protein [Streptomyces sp. WAC06614]RSS72843.1 hypothetical protein EF918_26035 [Streptomyces sp. WAC06614]
MSGTRRLHRAAHAAHTAPAARAARTARAALAKALMVACAVLLCLFGAGPALAESLGEPPAAATAPAEPAAPGEGQPDPTDAEVRAALRGADRGAPVRRPDETPAVPAAPAPRGRPCVAPVPEGTPSLRAVRSVVLRC